MCSNCPHCSARGTLVTNNTVIFENCLFEGPHEHAATIMGSYNAIFLHCTFRSNWNSICVQERGKVQAIGCNFSKNTLSAVFCSDSQACCIHIENCLIDTCDAYGKFSFYLSRSSY
jgi:hypothetical protein